RYSQEGIPFPPPLATNPSPSPAIPPTPGHLCFPGDRCAVNARCLQFSLRPCETRAANPGPKRDATPSRRIHIRPELGELLEEQGTAALIAPNIILIGCQLALLQFQDEPGQYR
uniref:Uncharacterized protein n=1 Tax=Oryza meridionalis TaxID=40149 RepID=A0A0E0BW37_9ORYZ